MDVPDLRFERRCKFSHEVFFLFVLCLFSFYTPKCATSKREPAEPLNALHGILYEDCTITYKYHIIFIIYILSIISTDY